MLKRREHYRDSPIDYEASRVHAHSRGGRSRAHVADLGECRAELMGLVMGVKEVLSSHAGFDAHVWLQRTSCRSPAFPDGEMLLMRR